MLQNVHEELTRIATMYSKGQFRTAMDDIQVLLVQHYDNPAVFNLAAACSIKLGEFTHAEAYYRSSLTFDPSNFETHLRLGILYKNLKRYNEAETCCLASLKLNPRHADTFYFLGMICANLSRSQEAINHYVMALRLKFDHADAALELGGVLGNFKRYAEAEFMYHKGLSFHPNDARLNFNLGCLLYSIGRFDEAEFFYRKTAALQPDNTDVLFNLSFILLQSGRFQEGWKLYEVRYDSRMSWRPSWEKPPVSFPQWRGEPIQGKSIVFWEEQGFGDVIQFSRYAIILKSMGAAHVSLVCDKTLHPFLQTLNGLDALYVSDDLSALGQHDYWTFLMSIPLCCGMTSENAIPSFPSYLSALPQRLTTWQPHIPHHGLRVGLVWKASRMHRSSIQRSLPSLRILQKLWKIPNITFISLQKEDGEEEGLAPPADQPLLHLGNGLYDFADTAAVVASLDLVISVDTAMVHVVGALGKPIWVLLPFTANWRWMTNRNDSLWYPSAKLFRQNQIDGWEDVVDRVANALEQFAYSHQNNM